MLENILISAVFMVFEIFVLMKWLQKRETAKNQEAWMPFRKLMLDSIVQHTDELNSISKEYTERTESDLDEIRKHGSLTDSKKQSLEMAIQHAANQIEASQKRFFDILQTVGPSTQPYVAQYCNEVLWFFDSIKKSLDKAKGYLSTIPSDAVSDNAKTSHPLSGVFAMLTAIKMFRDMRFAQFKSGFTQSVWKTEGLHFFEKDNEFLPPQDYAQALDGEKAIAEMNKIPRTIPIKSFFEK